MRQFLEVKGGSPATLRIFGLLNMNSLSRRLRLDFTDLTDKGLAYDKVEGVLQGTDGQFTTAVPLTLKGPPTIVVDGQVNKCQQKNDARIRGEGGMGRVHLARQRSLGRDVAIKSLKEEVADTRVPASGSADPERRVSVALPPAPRGAERGRWGVVGQ